jgi:hypothetical protein
MAQHTILRSSHRALRIAVVATILLSTASAFAATVVSSFKAKGAFAYLDGSDGECTWYYMSVSRGGALNAPETYLYYYVYNGCTNEWAYGNGRIPNSSFTVSGRTSRLRTDPTASPEFYTLGQTGRIDLTWTEDRSIRSKWESRSETITPTQRFRNRGKGESSAATSAGKLLWLSLRDTPATVGRNTDVYIEVIR